MSRESGSAASRWVGVEAAAGLITLQDGGRWGLQKIGVSVGGAMDPAAATLANVLAGNDRGAALIEMGAGSTLTLSFPTGAHLVLTGVGHDTGGSGDRLPLWSPLTLASGRIIRLRISEGRFGYLASAGGFEVPLILGGRGTDLRSGWGGIEGRTLRTGDRLPLGPSHRIPPRTFSLAPELRPPYRRDPVLRILRGSHWTRFTEAGRRIFFTTPYVLTPHSDRMGYRLAGVPIRAESAGSVASEPVTAGSIQVPPDGQPIVLMADRPTVGGYPRIGEVIGPDLPLLAQLGPGDPVRFRLVDHAEACRARLAFETALERLTLALHG